MLITLLIFKKIDAGPVVLEDIDFKDTWEYKTEPHNQPLLAHTSINHVLPVAVKRQVIIFNNIL